MRERAGAPLSARVNTSGNRGSRRLPDRARRRRNASGGGPGRSDAGRRGRVRSRRATQLKTAACSGFGALRALVRPGRFRRESRDVGARSRDDIAAIPRRDAPTFGRDVAGARRRRGASLNNARIATWERRGARRARRGAPPSPLAPLGEVNSTNCDHSPAPRDPRDRRAAAAIGRPPLARPGAWENAERFACH